MIYLCSPYSHPDPAIREQRYQSACRAVAALLNLGERVLSPVVHSHPLVACGLPTEGEFWEGLDSELLLYCDELAVLKLEGWQESRGVLAEIWQATELGKPIWSLTLEGLENWNGDRETMLIGDVEEGRS